MSESKQFFFCNSFTRLAAAALRFLNFASLQQTRWLQLHSTSLHLTSIMFESVANDLQEAQWLSGRVLDSRPRVRAIPASLHTSVTVLCPLARTLILA